MKKLISTSIAFIFLLLLLGSCGSSKGCGLTSDANQVQNSSKNLAKTNIVAEVK